MQKDFVDVFSLTVRNHVFFLDVPKGLVLHRQIVALNRIIAPVSHVPFVPNGLSSLGKRYIRQPLHRTDQESQELICREHLSGLFQRARLFYTHCIRNPREQIYRNLDSLGRLSTDIRQSSACHPKVTVESFADKPILVVLITRHSRIAPHVKQGCKRHDVGMRKKC